MPSTDRLANDPSTYVRSAAANRAGLPRATSHRHPHRRSRSHRSAPTPCIDSLAHEENRLAMNIAQNRSIKFVRPTDECDVCEGIGINYGTERFKRVRSVVPSENVLSSHGRALLTRHGGPRQRSRAGRGGALADVVRTDENVFSVGSALDALNRLANLGEGDADVGRAR